MLRPSCRDSYQSFFEIFSNALQLIHRNSTYHFVVRRALLAPLCYFEDSLFLCRNSPKSRP